MPPEIVLVTDSDREEVRRQEAEIIEGLAAIDKNIKILGASLSHAVQLLIDAKDAVSDEDLRRRIRDFLDKE